MIIHHSIWHVEFFSGRFADAGIPLCNCYMEEYRAGYRHICRILASSNHEKWTFPTWYWFQMLFFFVPLLRLSHFWELILPFVVYYTGTIYLKLNTSQFTGKIQVPLLLSKGLIPVARLFEDLTHGSFLRNNDLYQVMWRLNSSTDFSGWPRGQREDSTPKLGRQHWVGALAFVSVASFQPVVTYGWGWRCCLISNKKFLVHFCKIYWRLPDKSHL